MAGVRSERTAQCAVPRTAPALATFRFSSTIAAPAADVFRWHEQPHAFAALTPSLVRIEQQEGGIRDGGRVTVSIGIGRLRFRWTLRHFGYVAGRRFCDEQEHGPFAVWRHAHLFQPIGERQTLYQDHIEWAVAGGQALNGVIASMLRPLLRLAFAHRHRVVQTSLGGVRRRRLRGVWRWAAALGAAAMFHASVVRAQTRAAVRTVPSVDLTRYAGDWYEIARFPNRFQRQCVGDVRASYTRRPDGRIDVLNQCRTTDGRIEARGVARIVDEQTFAKLKVRFAPAWLSFVPAVWGDYWIIGLAPDYSWAVVGAPGRDYLWILARTPQLDEASIEAARTAARENGFDVDRLMSTSQTAARRP
jgi:apolipoprotein D and lipocalin family protein